MKQRSLRVGIVGAGTVSSGSHLPILVNTPNISIDWICDSSLATARSVARAYSIDAAYERIAQCPDVDVVLIATPLGSRRQVVPEVLSRGWHAFCEKPFAATLDEHNEYEALAEQHRVQIGVAYVRRFTRPSTTARRLVSQRFLGSIKRVTAAEGVRVRGTGRGADWYMADPKAGGGILFETGSHLLDQVLYVIGATDVTVSSCAQRLHRGLEIGTTINATALSGQQWVECSFELSMNEDLCNGIFVELEECVMRIGLYFDSIALLSHKGEWLCDLGLDMAADTPPQAFYLEWADFLHQCRTGEPSSVAAANSRSTTALIDLCGQRAEHGERQVYDAQAPAAIAK
jgi:predicted dehydrogenase